MEEGGDRMYDYVIVGAGSAGCVLADRLSEDPDVSVLLIEAGPPDAIENIHVPIAFGQLFRTEVDWDYSTTAEPFADRRRIYLPRGKTLGGCSSTNAMVYIRGNRLDYDGWREQGCEGWGYDDLLPYFKRAEDNEHGASEMHGAGGPLTVSDDRAPTRSPTPSSRPAPRPAYRPTRISTAPSRTASGATSAPSARAVAVAQRSPTCIRLWPAPT